MPSSLLLPSLILSNNIVSNKLSGYILSPCDFHHGSLKKSITLVAGANL